MDCEGEDDFMTSSDENGISREEPKMTPKETLL
jgi:hypothetical protein